jgi:glycosyltransferase involved in cell wall biosynthesis/predicted Zn-dependent protease
MPHRYLFGPVSHEFAQDQLHTLRQRGDCLAFGASEGADLTIGPADSWEAVCARLPEGWRPDFIALYLPYMVIPECLWSAPVPLVGLAPDWQLLFHSYRHQLPRLDLVLTDTAGVEVLAKAGITHTLAANLFGCADSWLNLPEPENPRDIDILFVGRLNPAVQRDRLPRLARLARLGDRYRVLIHTEVFGAAYQALLRRARIVFNRSVRGECNLRALEAAAAGALLFQEAGNREVPAFFSDRQECVFYGEDTLEPLLVHYLEHEAERAALAEAARQKVQGYSFTALWEGHLARIDERWSEVTARAEQRLATPPTRDWRVRAWQALVAPVGSDPGLEARLGVALAQAPRTAALHNALGLAVALRGRGPLTREAAAEAAACFRRALEFEPDNVLWGLNRAEALTLAGQPEEAAAQARRTLAVLQRSDEPAAETLDAGHFPAEYDAFRVEWERAAWQHAGWPAGEARAKTQLLRWRVYALLGLLTGETAYLYEAALARPDLAPTRAALGRMLALAGRPGDAALELRAALEANPFDCATARDLFEALKAAGEDRACRRLAQERRLLAQVAPALVRLEDWFVECPPLGNELTSLVILCCNQLDFTRQCLESVLRHTRAPYELILVDNGSTDGTPAYLQEVSQRPGPERVVVIRNEENRGFAAGCNQGLAQARGRYLVLLNNDTLVTSGWLEGLIEWVLRDWPAVGMVGPVTSWSAPPQQIPVDYRMPQELEAFAARRRRAYLGQALGIGRLLGFCLLLRREVLEAVGGLDEGFGPGFFEDDDLSLRVRKLGFRLLVALDVFIHHYGNRTFVGLGIDARKLLQENFERFKTKWGEEHAAGYHLPGESEDRGSQRIEDRGSRSKDREEAALNRTGATPPSILDPPSSILDHPPRVSLCMIVKNEERHLARCLRSVADLVDEMIVVDTGSSDRTREIATECGAQVFDFVWVDSFAAARNESLRHATGEWVLWLDADEYLDEDNRTKLRALFERLGHENACYLMRQRSPLEAAAHAATAVDQVRLFRNQPGIRWSCRVHEQILPAVRQAGGQVIPTDVVIEHVGFAEPELQAGKIERNRRLLELELEDRPDDPFVLYNLGGVALTAGQHDQALDYLQRSLEQSHPSDALARKLHALIARAHHETGRADEALAACCAGRAHAPDDPELLYWEAILRNERGDLAEAESCLLRVLETAATHHFMSFDAGLCGYRTRHFLANLYYRQGRQAEAEGQWRAALAERPDFTPGWQALAELLLGQQRWAELDEALVRLARDPQAAAVAGLLHVRALLLRQEYPQARQLVEGLIAANPRLLPARVLLSHVLLQQGSDLEAAEQALRAVLDLDPGNAEAPHNLAVLLRQRGQQPGPMPERTAVRGAAAGKRPKVSLCLIVRNEEDNLPACLGSAADLVDEIVVVDTGSTDRTKEIATGFGAKVFDFPWVDDFAAARNESLRHATGCWVFWLDADDRLDADNRAKLRVLFAGLGEDNTAYVMSCLCLPDPVSRVATTVHHLRLFRNHSDIRWSYCVHEQILPALRRAGHAVRFSDVVIQHTGYQDPALRARKLQRDLRLLERDQAERPDDPFTLFNLGQVYQEQARIAEALALFRRSLQGSQPTDSIVRKLYALLAQGHHRLGQRHEALAACREGLAVCPDDLELLFQQGVVQRGLGDQAGAEASWRKVLETPPGEYFASVPEGLRGHLTRHNLAALYREQGRHAEAEQQWRAALEDRPDYEPAWRGLADLLLSQQRWDDLEALARGLETGGPDGELWAVAVRARGLLARKEFAAGRVLLEGVCARYPQALEPRQLLSYMLLQEGLDWDAAEGALRAILALDRDNTEARQNLAVLLRQQGRPTTEVA